MKTIAIIPTRKNSKRLPGKNIRKLLGKPLIEYTIETALKSKHIDKIFIATDDGKVKEISKKYNLEVIDLPPEVTGDDKIGRDVVSYVLQVFKNKNIEPETIVLLEVTSPLRNTQDIDNSIEFFQKNDCESVIAAQNDEKPYVLKSYRKTKKGYLKPLFNIKYTKIRTQDLPKIYIKNCSIYISTPKSFQKYRDFLSNKTLLYEMPEERSVHIDNEIDFMLAELLMKKQKEESN